MKRLFLVGILCILFAQFGAANIYLTEVMHSPTQVSDSEGEWVEIYNDASQPVDLSSWTLDGKAIGNRTINPKEYFVLARELLDGSDTDNQSFESYWGNNNGIWDEKFNATEVSMSLKDEDTIVLTNGQETDSFTYNSSLGGEDGRTLERQTLTDWEEGPINGTPGAGNFSTSVSQSTGNEITLLIDVLNNPPEIISINMTDESEEDGVQVIPVLGQAKQISLNVLVNDSDGFENIQQVTVNFANTSTNMSFKQNSSWSTAWYTGTVTLNPEQLAGEYLLEITAQDSENQTQKEQAFVYEGIVSTQLNVSSFSITMQSGGAETKTVELLNSGNVLVDTQVSAEDLISNNSVISKNAISIFENVWLPLDQPLLLDANIAPMTKKEFQFRIQLPEQVKSGKYEGKIILTSMESTNGN